MRKLHKDEAKELMRLLSLFTSTDKGLSKEDILETPELFNPDKFIKIMHTLDAIRDQNCPDCDEHLFDLTYNYNRIKKLQS